MARIESLDILMDPSGKALLAELYGKTIENVMKNCISSSMKNTDLSGDPESGSVEAKRFANATAKDYGTARAAGKGDQLKAKPVVVQIDTDREIIEELKNKDVKLFGVEGLVERRTANHHQVLAVELDRAFFRVADDAATTVDQSGFTDVFEELENIIQTAENTKNDYVNGVPREMMSLVLNTEYYGKVRNQLDTVTYNSNVDSAAEEFKAWHGVRTHSCTRLPEGCKYLLIVDGAVAQPVMANEYKAEKIPLSDDYALELFFYYGTKAVTPDLIFKAAA